MLFFLMSGQLFKIAGVKETNLDEGNPSSPLPLYKTLVTS